MKTVGDEDVEKSARSWILFSVLALDFSVWKIFIKMFEVYHFILRAPKMRFRRRAVAG